MGALFPNAKNEPIEDPIRVLVVDDHQMFAQALDMVLAGEKGIEVAGVVGTAEDALELVILAAPDVVLMDIDLPGMDGLEATRRIREVSISTQVVIVSASPSPSTVVQAIEAGACGFIHKTQAPDHLIQMVRKAASGGDAWPAEADMKLATPWGGGAVARRPLHGRITARELEILQGIADGLSTSELARSLNISSFTVQTHVKNILSKLGVRSKVEAVTSALRRGLIVLAPNNQVPGDGGIGMPERGG